MKEQDNKITETKDFEDIEIDLETDGNNIVGGGKTIGIDLGTSNGCLSGCGSSLYVSDIVSR